MKTQHLFASAAAILITFANLSVVNYNVTPSNTTASSSHAIEVTSLPAVQVHPSATELRQAALLTDIGTAGLTTVPSMIRADESGQTQPFRLFGSELAMPYYSFGTKFGRIIKE